MRRHGKQPQVEEADRHGLRIRAQQEGRKGRAKDKCQRKDRTKGGTSCREKGENNGGGGEKNRKNQRFLEPGRTLKLILDFTDTQASRPEPASQLCG